MDLATYSRSQPATGQPWDERPPGCKCYRVEPGSIADRPGREAIHNAPEDVMTQWNRCKYFLRPGGCNNGDNCPYCHVHPVPKHLTGGGVVRGRKLGKKERRRMQGQPLWGQI